MFYYASCERVIEWESTRVGALECLSELLILNNQIMSTIKFHQDLKVFKKSFDMAQQIYDFSKSFPKEELYSLTDQIRRSSRSVSANISEAWGKRKYERSFIAKLTDSEGEARETQTWLQFALACEYINTEEFGKLNNEYNQIIGMLVIMMGQSEKWCSFSSLDTEQKD